MARVEPHDEVSLAPNQEGAKLCFQRCTFHWDDGNSSRGYRFTWRRANGNLVAARGQAFIPNRKDLESLTNAASAAGWY